METFIEVLEDRAAAFPEKTAFTFLDDGEEPGQKITYGRLRARACAIATELSRLLGPGDRAVLLYPPGIEFIEAYFGCLYAGVIAVPLSFPTPARLRHDKCRLSEVFRNASPKAVLTVSQFRYPDAIGALVQDGELLRWIHTDVVDTRLACLWRWPQSIDRDSIAFLQYTSGSVDTPKGVMVTHGNLLTNTEMIMRSFDLTERDVLCHWLPMHHDMGLIGHTLGPVLFGSEVYFMSPIDFLQRPLRWLKAITRFRATIATSPNFGYDLCAGRASNTDKAELDLSSWTKALNGAEPIVAATMDRFSDIFAPCGFRKSAFRPCYGLAEATLLVSGTTLDPEPVVSTVARDELARNRVVETTAGSTNTIDLVASGTVAKPGAVVIVDPSTRLPCTQGQIGEIWLRGDHIAAGYWRNDFETEATFQARLADGTGLFLRSGDLGILRGSHLIVTGRIKDIIIQRGANFYPQDLERTAEEISGARSGRAAAFGVMTSKSMEERVVVVVEINRRYHGLEPVVQGYEDLNAVTTPMPISSEMTFQSNSVPRGTNATLAFGTLITSIVDSLREELSSQHGISVYDICVVPGGSIPKTSSGKIQRSATRDLYLSNRLQKFTSLQTMHAPG